MIGLIFTLAQQLSAQSDSLDYKGYRLSIFQLEAVVHTPTNKKWVISMANTGKFSIPLYPEKSMEKYTIIQTSTPELAARLNEEYDLILGLLKDTRQTLKAGKYVSALTLEWQSDKKRNQVDSESSQLSLDPEQLMEEENHKEVLPSCCDLVIENLKVIKRRKKKIYLAYKILNKGKEKAKIFDSNKDQNIAVKAYISGTPTISRGTTVVGGAFLHRNEEMGDELAGGDSIEGILEFKIEENSRYTPVLVLEIDVFNLVHECNEGNNTSYVMLP